MIGIPTVKSAVKRLSDITVEDLHNLPARDINRILTILPIVTRQVEGEVSRRQNEDLTKTG